LADGEPSHIDNFCGVDAHSLKRWLVSDRRDYELSVVLEANEPAIEEVIDAGRQKQAILRREPERSEAEPNPQANKFSPARMLFFGPNSAPNSGRIPRIES
jgi:hypothetical protein